ncbi:MULTISPECIES: hypothetical protein [unclassified Streptomyces]|uniref:hypothetical protein n=1 Tax=unclassified Streptomyces TaxID=2593676 RepID=UPI000A61F05B|nr:MULTISPECIES: hypothetical protein [unclassified Streptomyces]
MTTHVKRNAAVTARIDTSSPRPPAAVTEEAHDMTYGFVVPGLIAVHTDAPSEAAARHTLAAAAAHTIDLHDTYLQVGGVTITGLDLVPVAAKIDAIDDIRFDNALPDADFHISDIARVAARVLGNGWEASAGAYAVVGYLHNTTRGTGIYTLSVVEDTLQLQHEGSSDPCSEFDGNDLPTLGKAVAAAVLDDLSRSGHCGQSTTDGAGNDGECRMRRTHCPRQSS